MASKKQTAKDEQGYTTFPMTCSNCCHFASDRKTNEYGYCEEKNKRCTIGGFSVKSMATCKRHVPREG